MRRKFASVSHWLTLALTLGLAAPVVAGPRDADLRAIQNFKLTPDFLARYEAYEQQDVVQNPCALDPLLALQNAAEHSMLDQTAAEYDAKPGAHAALQRHGLTAHDVLLGMAVWVGAAAQDLAAQNPELVKSGEIQLNPDFKISPENLVFYRQHKDEFRQHQMRLAQEQMQRHGGHLPECK